MRVSRFLWTASLLGIPTLLWAQGPANFPTSLHATREGKATWYSAENGGFETLTQIPIEDLGCKKCHPGTYADGSQVDPASYSPGCADCHNLPDTTVAQEQCLKCHGRQGTEIAKMQFADVHRDMGFTCTDCHTKKDTHGDGTAYASMFEPGAIDKQCTDCHQEVPRNTAHDLHLENVDCRACHMTSSVTCYNCHFESLVQGHVKRAWGGLKGFMLLGKDPVTNKVRPATFMALSYQGKAFYALAPYTAHNITAQPRECSDCHANENVQAYNTTGQIQVARWDEAQKKVVPAQGVIPIPPDWRTALKFDFLTYNGDPAGDTDPNQWTFLKSEADTSQIMYLEPLGPEELEALSTPMPDQFETSLHGTRQGKVTFYSKENGGFETLTDIPMDSLPCTHCHAANYADGTPVDAATYEPGCKDCHDFSKGYAVGDSTCLMCHARQNAEIAMGITDEHRAMGFQCTTCHTKREMHGDGTAYASMLQPGAMDASCDNDGCHPLENLPQNLAHNIHKDDVYCTACHSQTVSTCYNCHFSSMVESHKKRFYGPPPTTGFTFLVNSEQLGKVTTATYQALVYQGKTFYTLAPFTGHTVTREARSCSDCHANDILQTYRQTGKIVVTRWDSTQGKIIHANGVIPVPPDWQQALQFDFVDYTGQTTDPTQPFDPAKWQFLKTGADLSQMMYATPLTEEQLNKLAMSVGVESGGESIPATFRLLQNYPNPFNPVTTVEFHLPKAAVVSLILYDVNGAVAKTLIDGKRFEAGVHRINVNVGDLPSGVYICRLRSEGFDRSIKMTLLK